MILPASMLALRALAQSKEPMTRTALAAQLDTSTENLWRSVKPLIAAGLVTEVQRNPPRPAYAPLLAATDAGRIAVVDIAPPPAEALPPSVDLTDRAVAVLRFLRAEARECRIPTQSGIAAAVGTVRSNIQHAFDRLLAAGCLVRDEAASARRPRTLLTPLGTAVADGVVPVVASPVRKNWPRPRKAAPKRTVAAAVARVRECFGDPPVPAAKPRGPDPRLAHRAPVPDPPKREEPAPVSGVRVMAPPSLARRGGILHPPPPQPAERPANMRKDEWFRRSTPEKSYLHDACARGVA